LVIVDTCVVATAVVFAQRQESIGRRRDIKQWLKEQLASVPE